MVKKDGKSLFMPLVTSSCLIILYHLWPPHMARYLFGDRNLLLLLHLKTTTVGIFLRLWWEICALTALSPKRGEKDWVSSQMCHTGKILWLGRIQFHIIIWIHYNR